MAAHVIHVPANAAIHRTKKHAETLHMQRHALHTLQYAKHVLCQQLVSL